MTEWARWARVPVGPGPGLDLMHARRRVPFARHAHAEYAIGVCLDGQERIDIAGSVHLAGPGSAVVIEPERVHDGAPANVPSFRYRVLYACPGQLLALAGVEQWPHFRSPVLDDPQLAAELAAVHRLLGAGGDPPRPTPCWSRGSAGWWAGTPSRACAPSRSTGTWWPGR